MNCFQHEDHIIHLLVAQVGASLHWLDIPKVQQLIAQRYYQRTVDQISDEEWRKAYARAKNDPDLHHLIFESV